MARLGYDDGQRLLCFRLSNGNLRQTGEEHSPISNSELEILGRVGARAGVRPGVRAGSAPPSRAGSRAR